MTTVRISEARDHLADLANLVAIKGERIIFERRGKGLCGLVSLEDIEVLKRLEEEVDLRLARKAMKEKGSNIPLERIRKELGL